MFLFKNDTHTQNDTQVWGKRWVLELESLSPSLPMTTHHLCLSYKTSKGMWVCVFGLGASSHTYTPSGDSILPSTDWKRLPFGLSLQRLWQMVDQPQASREPLLKKNSPGIPPPHSLKNACKAGPICSHCFPGTLFLGFT